MTEQAGTARFTEVDTERIAVDGAEIAYRELGPAEGTPLVALNHLGANLDDWDPRIADGLAAGRRVILLGYRGVGRSDGAVRASIDEMADDALAAVRALGLTRFDLFGLSMGGMVAQRLVAKGPESVERLVLISSGPTGGPELVDLTRVMIGGTVRAILGRADPKASLFFTRTAAGRQAAQDYTARLQERTRDRDRAVVPNVLRAQLSAVHRYGKQPRPARSTFDGPVAILHGDSDRMVPLANAAALAEVFPGASVTVLPDAGHGAVFQHHREVVTAVRSFLQR
ncbi:alpha/beta hydrolase [Plantibacter sp. VKM Ac-2880]|uniref:alpha/beta fold hydrolase n=1 Tax=Plantibacter sp. VKM Ac-2880 TaxID=2783827 RepID=UPI00188DF048|nr:alpha/beta hydrolase [Plantibacter sp. VKM Ac-2880]MBF4567719.1 alpha/beta hydrolase [Plantibacter sp. VKM Ac-2880]